MLRQWSWQFTGNIEIDSVNVNGQLTQLMKTCEDMVEMTLDHAFILSAPLTVLKYMAFTGV